MIIDQRASLRRDSNPTLFCNAECQNVQLLFDCLSSLCFLGGSWNQHFAPVRAHFPGGYTPIRISSTAYFLHLGPRRTPQGGQVIHLPPKDSIATQRKFVHDLSYAF